MIIDLQRRLAEAGRIRIGHQVPTSNGKTRPEKLDRFRLTSADKLRIEQAAALFGGKVQPWAAPAGHQWEVITDTATLNVVVPPADMAFSQAYELWSAGGCQRRCDGRAETISEGSCLCDPDARECSIHTRLSVLLSDLPGLGVWRVDTSGYYAAVELQGAVEVIRLAAGRGQMLPARLRLDQRQVKRLTNGKAQTRRFAVPVLDVEVTPGRLLSGSADAPALDGQQESRAALTPVPASLSVAPVPSIAAQAVAVEDDDVSRPVRRNSAAPLPSTGVEVRTAVEAAADDQPPVSDAGDGITPAQVKKIGASMRELGITDRTLALRYVADTIGRDVDSRNELSKAEASQVIESLERDAEPVVEPDTGWPEAAGPGGAA